MKIEMKYREENGYLYPDFALPKQTHCFIGKYGDLRLNFIKAHRQEFYNELLLSGKLHSYLADFHRETAEQVRTLTIQLAITCGIDETLKADDMLRWVGEMNNAKQEAEEIVLRDTVYC